MDELTCPHCGYFAESDLFYEINTAPIESGSGKEYGKYECPNCGEHFCIED